MCSKAFRQTVETTRSRPLSIQAYVGLRRIVVVEVLRRRAYSLKCGNLRIFLSLKFHVNKIGETKD